VAVSVLSGFLYDGSERPLAITRMSERSKNRLDFDAERGHGVGFQILETAAFDPRMPTRVQSVEIRDAINAEQHRYAIDERMRLSGFVKPLRRSADNGRSSHSRFA
jgi:hypothetical protein